MKLVAIEFVLILSFLSNGTSATLFADDDWDRHPAWSGAWRVTPQIEKLLGIDQKKEKANHPGTLQIGFLIDKEIAARVMGEDAVKSVQERFSKVNQKIIAVGSWKADPEFKGYSARDSFCFVTKRDGITFLWIGTPTKSFMGAEVHFVRGIDPKHDLLVLDFGMSNWMKKRSRRFSGNAVGYTRNKY